MIFKVIWQTVAACQAAFILGMFVLILWYHLKNIKTDLVYSWDKLCMILSYILVSVGTVITVYKDFYEQIGAWHICIFLGYALGDVAIIFSWRRTVQARIRNKIIRDELKDKME